MYYSIYKLFSYTTQLTPIVPRLLRNNSTTSLYKISTQDYSDGRSVYEPDYLEVRTWMCK